MADVLFQKSPPPPCTAIFGAKPPSASLMSGLVLAATVAAYLPALGAGFIWDDRGHVTRQDLQTWSGLGRIWFEFGATQQYYPVLHSAFWLEHRFWGDTPFPYHLLNILLHAACACILALTLRRVLRHPPAMASDQSSASGRLSLGRLDYPGVEWIAAFLFALHPVGVESVAWISEQKNTLSTLFYLLALWCYLAFDDKKTLRFYLAASAFFVLAVLTKSVTATLPAALVVIMWWRHREIGRQGVLPLLPWFIFSAAFAFVTASFEHELIGAHGAEFALTPTGRALLAGRVVWFYLGKLLWPNPLIFIYPRWIIDPADPGSYVYPLGLVIALVGLWRNRGRWPAAWAFALLYIGSLFPAMGFVEVFPFLFSYVADHFQYLASLSFFAAAAFFLGRVLAPIGVWLARGIMAALLLVLAIRTWDQAEIYQDVFTLYQTTIDRNPACWLAENNLAEAEAGAGHVAEAVPHLERALALRPGFAEAENNLGDDLRSLGRPLEAIPHLQRALALHPGFAEAHNNLGAALMQADQPASGIAEFRAALRGNPHYAQAAFNLGSALASTNHIPEALTYFQLAVQLNPKFAQAELNWGLALAFTGQYPRALAHFAQALRLEPSSAELYSAVGRAALETGHYEDAVSPLQRAVELDPPQLDAHRNLSLALQKLGRVTEAEAERQQVRNLEAETPRR